MAEPLKGKVMIGEKFEGGCVNSLNDDDNVLFKSKDVQSAVEWLKSRLKAWDGLNPIIDKAFEDVMK